MRQPAHFALIPTMAVALFSCRPAAPLSVKTGTPTPPPVVTSPSAAPVRESAPSRPISTPSIARKSIRGIEFEGVTFDARSHRLLVIDQSLGPGTSFHSAQDVAASHGALAALNAGFFTPEGKPLGLVVTNGRRYGAWNSASSLGSGIFAENASGALLIARRSSSAAFSDARELIQAGPLLVENSAGVGGLDQEKPAIRSVMLTDGGNLWWIGKTSLCTLAALGEALASGSPAPWPVRHALNLDGGRSTDFFVSAKVPGGPIERRGIFNRPVRNFLILMPR